MPFLLGFDFYVKDDSGCGVYDGCSECGVSRFLWPVRVDEAFGVPCGVEFFAGDWEWDVWRVW